jgi:putative ABC transport system permease protein
MATLWQDMRYGFRMLVKNPGFTTMAVLTLALGIGANTAIFSIINAVLLKPLPFDEPDRLVMIWQTDLDEGNMRFPVSYPNIEDWRRECRAFEDIAAFCPRSKTFYGQEYPVDIDGVCASANLFHLLRINPLLGRLFTAEEEQSGIKNRVVLSYAFWRQHCQTDPNIVGTSIRLGEGSYTIIGVLPDICFPGEYLGRAQIWTLITEEANYLWQRGAHCFQTIARLMPGVSLNAAQSQVATIAARLAEVHENNQDMGARVTSLHSDLVRDVCSALLILFGAVGMVLLIACMNTANLLLIRANVRTREFAIRAALGAGRGRLIRQALVESLLLTLISSVAALIVAHGGIAFFKTFVPGDLPRIQEVALNGPVIAFTLLIACVTGVVVGLIPAIGHSVLNAYEALKGSSSSTTETYRSRMRNILVTDEIAVSMVLLVGAALLLHSFWDLTHVDTGFQSDQVLTWHAALPGTTQNKQAVFAQLLERTQAIPGVRTLGATTNLPFAGSTGVGVKRIGGPASLLNEWLPTRYNAITPDYFKAMRITLRKGRLFTNLDTAGKTGSLIINETMARLYFPGEDPIGQRIHCGLLKDENDPKNYEIVGIVSDTKQLGYDREIKPEIFVPYTQQTWNSMTFAARVQGNPLAFVNHVRAASRQIDRNILIDQFKTMTQWQAESVAGRRFVMILITLFTALALCLTIVGVYGVIAYAVAQRIREIGVRIALGALRGQILRFILRQTGISLFVALALGLTLSTALSLILRSLVYDISPLNPLSLLLGLGIIGGTACLACLLPAIRAIRVDPMEALRYE